MWGFWETEKGKFLKETVTTIMEITATIVGWIEIWKFINNN